MRADVEHALAPVLEAAGAAAHEVDKEGTFPAAAVDALRRSGLLGLPLPRESGGMGAGPHDVAEVVFALAEACGSTAMVYLMHVSASMTVAGAPVTGRPELVRELAGGRLLATLAFSERGSRSHFWSPVSQAVVEGDGVRVRADKSWVTSAGHADLFVISTRTAGGEASDVDLYALPADTPGLKVAGPWQGMGLRGNDSCPMTVDALLTAGDRIGGPAAGFGIMMGTVLPWFNLGNAAVSLGLASGATRAAVRHCGGARFEQVDQALADLPTIRQRLARMTVQLAAQRAYLRTVADALVSPDDGTTLHVLSVKAGANDAALVITDEAMRVCGGAAFSQHLGVDRYFRDARAGSVMAPTADVLYDFIGKAVTGRPLF